MNLEDYHVLNAVILLLACALIATCLFRRFHLPPILGYLTVGIIVGPYSLALLPNTDATRELAEFGVVFLMFTIGLEFSLGKLLSMKRLVIGLGGLQVLLTFFATATICWLFTHNSTTAIIIGSIVAMSSTAIVSKQLTDQLELHTQQGHNAIGILLFQDLAVILFLILIPSLGQTDINIFIPLGWALLKATIAVTLIILLGRWVLRPGFQLIASTKSIEIFTLAILLVTLSFSLFTQSVGLSLALGAFAAGMMLGETKFRHQIEIEIRPFRDVLLGLFFVTIGMLLNIKILPEIWLPILGILALLLLLKFVIIAILSLLFGSTRYQAVRTGLILSHGGEFGFAVLTVAINNKMIADVTNQSLLGALICSMAIAPFLIRYNKKLSNLIVPKASQMDQTAVLENVTSAAVGLKDHVIICGYGRVGQNIARFLEKEGFEYIALDMEPKRVQTARLTGERVSYGNSANLHLLEAAGLSHAKALIISFNDVPAALKILTQVRQHTTTLPILVRTPDDSDLQLLKDAGATEVIPETLEASLMLAFHMLILLGIPYNRAINHLRLQRQDRYQLLHQFYPGDKPEDLQENLNEYEHLRVFDLPENARVIGKPLSALKLDQFAVRITALCRDQIKRPDPEPTTILQADDVLVLYGSTEGLESAERYLLKG